jgi:hypothetical protein
MLSREEKIVLAHIGELVKGDLSSPVTIGTLHHTFSDMDVSELVKHLLVLLDKGLINNAGQSREKISNTYVMTQEGIDCCTRIIEKR